MEVKEPGELIAVVQARQVAFIETGETGRGTI